MQVVILAAGSGKRLKYLTKDVPKPMVEINNKPLIGYTLEILFKIKEVNEVIIVTGYRHEIIESYVKSVFHDNISKVKFVHNEDFFKGSVITIRKAKDFINDTFLITNADHIFPLSLLSKIVKEKEDVTIGCDCDRNLTNDDMKVYFEDNVLIKMGKKLDKYDSGYIGLTVVDKSLISDYFDCANAALKKKGEQAVVEDILLELSSKGVNIHKCDLSNFGWFEIDTPGDYEIAKKGLKNEN